MAPPILSLRGVTTGFGGVPLFSGVDLHLARGERVCLVGRNGAGKSTLLRILAGEADVDAGERYAEPGAALAYLPQEARAAGGETALDHVLAGFRGEASPVEMGRAAGLLAELRVASAAALAALSGGELRRVSLARALAVGRDVLLLDEPTNHLDLPTIAWLEESLLAFKGALLVVSHDRVFLARLTRRTLWLDRGRLRGLDAGFAAFETWRDTVALEEAGAAARLDAQLKREERYMLRGVTGRRTRNEMRVERLAALRAERSRRIADSGGTANLKVAAGGSGGELVIDAERIGKRVGERWLVRDLTTRVLRGDRLGIIGPSGAGKTTLLGLLLGTVAPDEGTVRLGAGLRIASFDQQRAVLDPEASVWRTLAPNGDTVMVDGRPRHVAGYAQEFLFPPERLTSPVKTLSGGERNRLLLARLFAEPSNVLAMDEPTNDLDMETLDLLVDALDAYAGTLLLVTHDRATLDRLVTGIIAFDPDGRVREYAGGYSDYTRQCRAVAPLSPRPKGASHPKGVPKPVAPRAPSANRQQRDLARAMARIETLNGAVAEMESILGDPDLFARDRARYDRTIALLAEHRGELATAEDAWLALAEGLQL
ncbi:MAG: ATP-binding cassette domain-containing protein [Alphaproteobacteria bacterium]|nr:ATP-binding cassette domain-containing protein [Alphaproteobacteria bacterium]